MKVANSYASLLRGVSQQVPQDRADGQHTEQVNLLSDPVDGLTRRHGSIWQAEKQLPNMSATEFPLYAQDFSKYVTLPFTGGGKDYVLIYRRDFRVDPTSSLPLFMVYNATDKAFLTVTRPVDDAALDYVEDHGIAAATQIGKYLFFSGRDQLVTGTSTDLWGSTPNNVRSLVWVRGGAFSRKFIVVARDTAGVTYTFSHTTPHSSYQGVLDTSDILADDPGYTKKVNDRVNAYNAAVTKWIGTSTADVQPAAIAEGLRKAAVDAGYPGPYVVDGTHLILPNCVAIAATDGGDGSLIRGVANEVESASAVSPSHYNGKVVKVRGTGSAEAYYLKATAKNPAVPAGAIAEVVWTEGVGVEHSITGGLLYGTIVGSTFYHASTPVLLDSITPGPHPTIAKSTVGDNDTSPMPFFVGQKITYLGTFQSRLLVGAGGVLALSKTEDYLNFFRSTVLTLPGDDPFEMLPQGSADDELRYGVLYDRDLVIFGKERQYVVSGSQALTPTGASMPVLASYEGSADASPVAAGGFIFYTKRGDNTTGVFQIQPGQTENSPESFPASSQIATYISGGATEFAISTGSPSHLLIRADGAPNSLYCFTYLDRQDGRKMDAWSRWDFATELGYILGVHTVPTGVLTFSLRQRPGTDLTYVVADLCPIKTGVSALPYLDSNRPWAQVGTGSLLSSSAGNWAVAYYAASTKPFTGSPLTGAGALIADNPGVLGLTAGALQAAYVIPTNPYIRDGKDKAILSGRLTVTRMTVAYKDTGGLKWAVTANGTTNEVEFSGRILGSTSNIVGIEPISTGQHNLPIGRETRQFSLRISARYWHPFTLTAIEYTGQLFNRVQRF